MAKQTQIINNPKNAVQDYDFQDGIIIFPKIMVNKKFRGINIATPISVKPAELVGSTVIIKGNGEPFLAETSINAKTPVINVAMEIVNSEEPENEGETVTVSLMGNLYQQYVKNYMSMNKPLLFKISKVPTKDGFDAYTFNQG
jgi:hypothetical protein